MDRSKRSQPKVEGALGPLTPEERLRRLEDECAKLDPKEEQAMAEEGIAGLDNDPKDMSVRTIAAMRGFLRGIDTSVPRDPDRV